MARLDWLKRRRGAGQYDQAINSLKEMAQHKDGPLPVDGILMELGRTIGRRQRADAQQTFNRLVQEFPESRFTAKRSASWIRSTGHRRRKPRTIRRIRSGCLPRAESGGSRTRPQVYFSLEGTADPHEKRAAVRDRAAPSCPMQRQTRR